MRNFACITQAGITPVVDFPSPEDLISGHPEFATWEVVTSDQFSAGIWQSTPGCWRISFSCWEYVRILSGHSIVHAEDGTDIHLRAGDSYVFSPGFNCRWEVVETTVKDFVVTPESAPVLGPS